MEGSSLKGVGEREREKKEGGVTWQLSGLSDGRDCGEKPFRNVKCARVECHGFTLDREPEPLIERGRNLSVSVF